MSAAEALKAARAAGIQLKIDGDDLVLEASVPPPPAVIDLLSSHKAGIVALLRPVKDGWSAEDWQAYFDERAAIFEHDGGLSLTAAEARAFEACIVEWLNRNPALSQAGRCVWCERPSDAVLPFGAEPGTHSWLHAQCWRPWHETRRVKAEEALCQILNATDMAQTEQS